ncbi:MAG: c-type cytochrome [Geminicoccaceae bacterium]
MDKGCTACHSGINIGGEMYATFGVVETPDDKYRPANDKGREDVTHDVSDEYSFKVPTLRNVALTAPYFHTGSVWDLREAVKGDGYRPARRDAERRRDRQDHRIPRQPDRRSAQGGGADPAAKRPDTSRPVRD